VIPAPQQMRPVRKIAMAWRNEVKPKRMNISAGCVGSMRYLSGGKCETVHSLAKHRGLKQAGFVRTPTVRSLTAVIDRYEPLQSRCRPLYPKRDLLDKDAGPDLLQQLFLRDELTGRSDEHGDDVEGAPAERHVGSVQP